VVVIPVRDVERSLAHLERRDEPVEMTRRITIGGLYW
jgi:hypothetical protein